MFQSIFNIRLNEERGYFYAISKESCDKFFPEIIHTIDFMEELDNVEEAKEVDNVEEVAEEEKVAEEANEE